MGYYFIYSSFFKNKWYKLHFKLVFFIDNENGIPSFIFAPLDYGYSGVYLQKCMLGKLNDYLNLHAPKSVIKVRVFEVGDNHLFASSQNDKIYKIYRYLIKGAKI